MQNVNKKMWFFNVYYVYMKSKVVAGGNQNKKENTNSCTIISLLPLFLQYALSH